MRTAAHTAQLSRVQVARPLLKEGSTTGTLVIYADRAWTRSTAPIASVYGNRYLEDLDRLVLESYTAENEINV